jgi:magnesium transporter
VLGKLALPEIRELIEAGDEATLGEVVNRWLAPDLAELLAELDVGERIRIFHLLGAERAAEAFCYLDLSDQREVLDSLSPAEAAAILNAMAPDDRTALLGELPSAQTRGLIELLEPGERAVARALLEYPEDSVGRLMTPDYVVVHKDWTIRRVLDHVRVHGRDSETLNVIYVVDGDGRLVDDLRIREILLAPLHTRVADLLHGNCIRLAATDDRKTAVQIFRKYDRTALPVVDAGGHLAGIVTLDDVLDVAEEEATREMQRFGGQEALDEPYLSTTMPAMVRKRASWLVILFVGEMFTATAMGHF